MNNQNSVEKLHQESTVNVNGEIFKGADAKISVFDRGFLYGDSIYEVTYSDNGNLIFFDEHLDRLFTSASLINMALFLNREKIIEETLKTLKASKIPDAYVRIIVTRGETEISLDPNISFENNLIIIVKPKPVHPQKFYNEGLNLHISSVKRNDKTATDPSAKSGNYLNNVMALADAKKAGADDAIMVNHDGFITEGTTFNIWMIKDDELITPPVTSGLLKGITRDKILYLAKMHNLKLKEKAITPEELLSSEEVFITSSTKGIMPVKQIDSVFFSKDRPMTNKIIQCYKDYLDLHISQKKFHYLE